MSAVTVAPWATRGGNPFDPERVETRLRSSALALSAGVADRRKLQPLYAGNISSLPLRSSKYATHAGFKNPDPAVKDFVVTTILGT